MSTPPPTNLKDTYMRICYRRDAKIKCVDIKRKKNIGKIIKLVINVWLVKSLSLVVSSQDRVVKIRLFQRQKQQQHRILQKKKGRRSVAQWCCAMKIKNSETK